MERVVGIAVFVGMLVWFGVAVSRQFEAGIDQEPDAVKRTIRREDARRNSNAGWLVIGAIIALGMAAAAGLLK